MRGPRKDNGGPNYYTVRRHRLGDKLIDIVERMMAADALSSVKSSLEFWVYDLVKCSRFCLPVANGGRQECCISSTPMFLSTRIVTITPSRESRSSGTGW